MVFLATTEWTLAAILLFSVALLHESRAALLGNSAVVFVVIIVTFLSLGTEFPNPKPFQSVDAHAASTLATAL